MKNREKYEQEMLNAAKDRCNADGFIETEVLPAMGVKCNDIPCGRCYIFVSLWMEEEYEPPTTDWSKVAVDTPILVRNSEDDKWLKRHFAKYVDGHVCAFCEGETSWTNSCNDEFMWNYAKLPEQEAENE